MQCIFSAIFNIVWNLFRVQLFMFGFRYKKYFEYVMSASCGIPYFVLVGTERDWIQLKEKFLEWIKISCPHLIHMKNMKF